uniref:Uncharacterized protein n=1 Tax=Anguilla anguilla TaxID=7936 RepID=A0A0E9WW15_ANGAN
MNDLNDLYLLLFAVQLMKFFFSKLENLLLLSDCVGLCMIKNIMLRTFELLDLYFS